jgi:hypothetical protein
VRPDEGYRGRGGRPRGKLAERTARVARLASMERDPEAATIATNVYGIAVTIKDQGSRIPLQIEAPLIAASERAALAIVRREQLPETEENVNDLAAYMVAVFQEAVMAADRGTLEHFRGLRQGRPS